MRPSSTAFSAIALAISFAVISLPKTNEHPSFYHSVQSFQYFLLFCLVITGKCALSLCFSHNKTPFSRKEVIMRANFPSSFRIAPAEVSTLPRRTGCCGVIGSVPSTTLDKSMEIFSFLSLFYSIGVEASTLLICTR